MSFDVCFDENEYIQIKSCCSDNNLIQCHCLLYFSWNFFIMTITMPFNRQGLLSLVSVSFAVSVATPAFSSGYHFGTQSVSAQSTANASSAEAADASTIFYNAAGISKLEGINISVNANVVAPSVKYSNAKGFYPGIPGQQQPISGTANGKITDNVLAVPHLYGTYQINPRATVGLGVYVPYGASTEYERDSVLRYNVNKTGMQALVINPNIAFKINENHSVGFGLIGQYMRADLRQYANLGRLAGGLTRQPIPNGVDGYAAVEGDDWGLGYNFGYLWDINDNARVGFSYRSKVNHHLKGKAEWNVVEGAQLNPVAEAAIRQVGYVKNENASVDLVTPESVSVHGMFRLGERWKTFGDITWTRHSRFKQLNVVFENPKMVADVSNPLSPSLTRSSVATFTPNWRDTFKIGVGAAYQYSDPLELRFGIAYDQSPIKDPNYRLSTLPDNDRIWLSLGANYKINDNATLGFAYSYIHIKDASANIKGWCGARVAAGPGSKNCISSRTDSSADYKSHAHILGVQFNYKF